MPKPRTETAIGLSKAPGYYSAVKLCEERVSTGARRGYPFNIPAIASLGTLPLDPKVSIFVGENGSGKSTLIEAIAVAAGLNAEGGSKNFNFSTRRSESALHNAIELIRGPRKERDAYFLRAECMYNVATCLEALDDYDAPGPKLIDSYGGVSLHEQSHGESFFAILANRFGEDSFLVMDEPESALSPARQLYLLGQMNQLVEKKRCQIVLATHSPILMSYPNALLYRLSTAGIERTTLQETEHYSLTRDFLGDHKAYMRRLFQAAPVSRKAAKTPRKTQENGGAIQS